MERTGPVELTSDEKAFLLDLARRTLHAHLTEESPPEVEKASLGSRLTVEAACFVTLTEDGSLRGCILDSFVPHEPIYRNVMRNVILAATGDPRFAAVDSAELDQLTIEVSVLGRPYPISVDDPDELVEALRPGVDGVILTTAHGSSTYLPQVWEQIPDPEEFLSELCRKHGAPGDCWRTDELLRVEVYQVNHFSESDLSSDSPAAD